MDDGPERTASQSNEIRRDRYVDDSLRMFYWWVCTGILILAGLVIVSVPMGVYFARDEGGVNITADVAAVQVVMLGCYLAAIVYAVRGLRRRRARDGFGRFTAVASVWFGLGILAMLAVGLLSQ